MFVVFSVGAAALIVAGGRLATGRPVRSRLFVGATIVAFILLILSTLAESLANSLAILTLIAATLSGGYDLFRSLNFIVN